MGLRGPPTAPPMAPDTPPTEEATSRSGVSNWSPATKVYPISLARTPVPAPIAAKAAMPVGAATPVPTNAPPITPTPTEAPSSCQEKFEPPERRVYSPPPTTPPKAAPTGIHKGQCPLGSVYFRGLFKVCEYLLRSCGYPSSGTVSQNPSITSYRHLSGPVAQSLAEQKDKIRHT